MALDLVSQTRTIGSALFPEIFDPTRHERGR